MGGFYILPGFSNRVPACRSLDDAMDLENDTIFTAAVFREGSNKPAESKTARPAGWNLPCLVGNAVGLHVISPFSATKGPDPNTCFASAGQSRVSALLDVVPLGDGLDCRYRRALHDKHNQFGRCLGVKTTRGVWPGAFRELLATESHRQLWLPMLTQYRVISVRSRR